MKKLLARLARDEEGATAVEYGLIVAAIAGVIAAVVFALGPKVSNGFNKVNAGETQTFVFGSARIRDAGESTARSGKGSPRQTRSARRSRHRPSGSRSRNCQY